MVVLVVASLALATAPQAAFAASGNAAATRTLARAAKTLLHAALPDLPKGLSNVEHYANEVAAQCPTAAAESPQNYGAEQLDDEVIGVLTVVGYRTAAGPIRTFYGTVKGLHWSNPRLTRAVKTFATKLDKLVGLTVPSLCGDVKEWVASGYKTLTASTVQFVKSYNAVDPEAEEGPLILRLSRPYATAGDIPLFHSIEKFESELAETEAHAVFAYKHLMNSIELNQWSSARSSSPARRGRSCRCAPGRGSAGRARPARRRRRRRSSPPGGWRSA